MTQKRRHKVSKHTKKPNKSRKVHAPIVRTGKSTKADVTAAEMSQRPVPAKPSRLSVVMSYIKDRIGRRRKKGGF